jgi:signal transduction histidine kinase
VALSDLVSQRASEFTFEHPERSVTSNVTGGIAIDGRPEFVERLMNNAFTNILRYTPHVAPVRIALDRVGINAQLVIEDGGPGLPSYGAHPQRFQRFDESRSRETGGSGLGMSIMADVAESLGGEMLTEPSPLGGLRLTFRVPLAAS